MENLPLVELNPNIIKLVLIDDIFFEIYRFQILTSISNSIFFQLLKSTIPALHLTTISSSVPHAYRTQKVEKPSQISCFQKIVINSN